MKHKIALLLFIVLLLMQASALAVDYQRLYNPTLMEWADWYVKLNSVASDNGLSLSDVSLPSGIIIYDPAQTRSNGSGQRMADGGHTSDEGTFTVGMGAGVNDEDLWYVTFTYNANADEEVMYYNTSFMLLSLTLMDKLTSVDDDTLSDLAIVLLTSDEDIAIEVDDLVLASKVLSGNQLLVMVDSLDFYNAFYRGSISNYIRL